MNARLAAQVARYPPFNRPEVRLAVVRGKARAERARRRLFERLGSARYSRPALYDMDRKLEQHLPFRGGFFVEAGANDGYQQSNTYYLEKFKGWTGILIEPIPELYRMCLGERPRSKVLNYALVPEAYASETVPMLYGGLMSLVPGAQGSVEADRAHAEAGNLLGWDRNYDVEVPARTLTSVLAEAGAPPQIDLLSLDVEGYEVDVLAGLDLDRWAPRCILIEVIDASRRRTVERTLSDRYVTVAQLSPFDLLLRRHGSARTS
jgi:FkbM family methyltransferase